MTLKQAQNNKTRRMTKYRVGRDSNESRIGKGKAEMRGQSVSTEQVIQNPSKEK